MDRTPCVRRAHRISPVLESRAFTLVELLVVIALIVILLSLLMGPIRTVWRSAAVLACPLVYVDAQGMVHVCGPEGQQDWIVCNIPATGGNPRWSPRGDKIAYLGGTSVVVVEPASGRTQRVDFLDSFEWVDNDTLVGTVWRPGGNRIWRVNLRDGKSQMWKDLPALNEHSGHIAMHRQPVFSPGYVVAEGERVWNPMMDIVQRSSEWSLKKTIWSDPGNDVVDEFPRMDAMGEYVGWTRGRTSGLCNERVVAFKHIKEEPSRPPQILGREYRSMVFCDWIGADLLVAIDRQDGTRCLAVIKKDGSLVRELAMPEGIAGGSTPPASWRTYGHW